jgi:hypothetical protein
MPDAEQKEQMYTLTFSKEELLERIKMLSNSENVTLYLKVQKGAAEADELGKLMQLVEQQ